VGEGRPIKVIVLYYTLVFPDKFVQAKYAVPNGVGPNCGVNREASHCLSAGACRGGLPRRRLHRPAVGAAANLMQRRPYGLAQRLCEEFRLSWTPANPAPCCRSLTLRRMPRAQFHAANPTRSHALLRGFRLHQLRGAGSLRGKAK